jgi:accessory gene regulator B
MRKITARIVHFFIESKVIDETDQEIYEYGLEILSENVMLTVFLLLFGVMIGKGIETCIFLFSFCWLRRFCGGYHAKMLMCDKVTQLK